MQFYKLIQKKIYNLFPLAALLLLLFVMLWIVRTPNMLIHETKELIKPYEYRGEVKIDFADGQSEIKTVPCVITTDQPFRVTLDLTKIGMIDAKSMTFITKNMLLRCSIDDEIIFRNIKPKYEFSYEDGNLMYIVDLPKTVNSNVITLYYENGKNYTTNFELKDIKIGKRINIITNYIFNENLDSVILIILMLIVFFAILTSGTMFRKHTKIESYFNYMAVFSFLTALYIITKIPISYFFLNRFHILIHIVNYSIPMFAPIILLYAVMQRTTTKYHTLIKTGIIFAACNAIIQHFLTLMNYQTLTMMKLYTSLIIVYIIIVICLAILNTENTDENPSKKMMLTIFPILVATIVELCFLLLTNRVIFTSITKLAILLLFIFISNEIFHFYIYSRDKNIKAEMYKKLAYTDKLTNVGNRLAYNDKLEFLNKENSSLYCISLDIDNLKYINDTFGHKYGDEIIIKLATFLKNKLENKYQKDIFRIGGDEFIVFYYVPKEYNIEKELKLLLEEYNNASILEDKSNKFGVSIGYSYYDKNSYTNIEDCIHKADQKMYTEKRKKKAQ